ncbi:MAG TPA: pyridoxal-phosphate dependent enzyme [Candidatus Manganitrophaceae bacterium]|nr:pyridoxal-phosphate dependent enzyme [Candidatus Manganitrophaceae bacterium]
MTVRLTEVQSAHETIRSSIDRTPLVHSRSLSVRAGVPVYLKLENLQKTGSFKVRGAFYRMSFLTAAERRRGVVAASAGNHAQGVALAANLLGVTSTIVMPEGASIAKQEATRAYGARRVVAGKDLDGAMKRAREIERAEGKVFIHPFDDEAVIAGQGTVGLEILEDRPDIATIIVPVGGGGLASGIAVAAKSIRPKIRIIGGVAPARPTLADGIAVKSSGGKTRPILARYLDRMIRVDEEEIAEAVLLLMEHKRIIAEGAGAVALAALLNHGRGIRGPVVLIVSGGNIDVNLLERIIERGLLRTGRLLRLSVVLPDRPGALARLTSEIAALGANILHIVHDRLSSNLPINQTRVELSLETRGAEQNRQVLKRLKSLKYHII